MSDPKKDTWLDDPDRTFSDSINVQTRAIEIARQTWHAFLQMKYGLNAGDTIDERGYITRVHIQETGPS